MPHVGHVWVVGIFFTEKESVAPLDQHVSCSWDNFVQAFQNSFLEHFLFLFRDIFQLEEVPIKFSRGVVEAIKSVNQNLSNKHVGIRIMIG